MRRALFIVVLLLFAPIPMIGAETETIHLWSEDPPGAVLLWDESGNLTSINPVTFTCPMGIGVWFD